VERRISAAIREDYYGERKTVRQQGEREERWNVGALQEQEEREAHLPDGS